MDETHLHSVHLRDNDVFGRDIAQRVHQQFFDLFHRTYTWCAFLNLYIL